MQKVLDSIAFTQKKKQKKTVSDKNKYSLEYINYRRIQYSYISIWTIGQGEKSRFLLLKLRPKQNIAGYLQLFTCKWFDFFSSFSAFWQVSTSQNYWFGTTAGKFFCGMISKPSISTSYQNYLSNERKNTYLQLKSKKRKFCPKVLHSSSLMNEKYSTYV